jgi:GNAT superfamily N-acetyltransferase
MEDMCTPALTLESKPNITDIRYLEERIYEFNVQATGISDGLRFGIFLRGADGVVVGGADGWTWGGTCYIHNLFVPAPMRKQGHGTRLMDRIEERLKHGVVSKLYSKPMTSKPPIFTESSVSN